MEGLWPIILIEIVLLTQSQSVHREHKVHNIVLYPDKHSWCQTQQIKQVISYPGCKSEEIDNNVCVGACFSYSIPHTEPSDPGEVIVPYCDSCQPSDTTWHHVTLQCEKNSDKTPPQLVKRVQIINNCSCSSCDNDHNRYKTIDENTEDTEDFLIMQQNEVPDLLRLLNNRNESNAAPPQNSVHTANIKSLMNHKIVTLLKNIQEKNSRNDKDQLIELLRTVQGPEHHKISDEKINDFVESLNSENVELDLVRLREVLSKFEHSKYFEKHRKYLTSDHLSDDFRRHHRQNLHHGHQAITADSDEQYSFPGSDEPKNSHERQFGGEDDHLHHRPDPNTDDLVSAHQNLDLPPTMHHIDVPAIEAMTSHQNTPGLDSHHNRHHGHHHHHIGERISGHGHLIKGPNGALVIEPDRIHEKLDMNPHELKPNNAGTLLSYSGQPVIDSAKSKTEDD